jgi:hypothetical protein
MRVRPALALACASLALAGTTAAAPAPTGDGAPTLPALERAMVNGKTQLRFAHQVTAQLRAQGLTVTGSGGHAADTRAGDSVELRIKNVSINTEHNRVSGHIQHSDGFAFVAAGGAKRIAFDAVHFDLDKGRVIAKVNGEKVELGSFRPPRQNLNFSHGVGTDLSFPVTTTDKGAAVVNKALGKPVLSAKAPLFDAHSTFNVRLEGLFGIAKGFIPGR